VQRHRLGPIKKPLKVGVAILAASCVRKKTQDQKRNAEDHRQAKKEAPAIGRGS
jgi:hypothetical protein